MSVDIQEDKQRQEHKDEIEKQTAPQAAPLVRLRQGLTELNWRLILIIASIMAITWCSLFLSQNQLLLILIGVVPVIAGMYMGRRVRDNLLLHGIMLGISGFLIGLVIILIYSGLISAGILPDFQARLEDSETAQAVDPIQLITIYLSFSAFALLPFPAFGTVIAGRAEKRNRELREQVEARGGQLERPSSVRTLEDLRGLSLPQLGMYVSNLFKKKGFALRDYHFLDKDKHLDLEMEYQDDIYLLRLSVADKVQRGTVESLAQDMRRREIARGMVITSTEFTPDAEKSARGRRNIVLMNGQTLFDVTES